MAVCRKGTREPDLCQWDPADGMTRDDQRNPSATESGHNSPSVLNITIKLDQARQERNIAHNEHAASG